MSAHRTFAVIMVALVAACDGTDRSSLQPDAPDPGIPGDYIGTFPCSNCPGIRVSLRLTEGGRYFLEQMYPDDDGIAAYTAVSIGKWVWEPAEEAIVLHGSGPTRTFRRDGINALVMQSVSTLEYRLGRSMANLSFDATFPMTGLLEAGADGVVMTECLTGLALSVESGGEYRRMARQLRKAGAGKPVFAEIDGRIGWTIAGVPVAVRITRFGTLRPGQTCP